MSPAGPLALGDTQVVLTYGSVSLTVPITVRSVPVLVSIAVTTPPNQLNYPPGTLFDPTGMLVTGYYSDGSSALLEYTLQGDLTITAQSHTIVVEAGGANDPVCSRHTATHAQPRANSSAAPGGTDTTGPTVADSGTRTRTGTQPYADPYADTHPGPTASPSPEPSPTMAPPSEPPQSPPAQGEQLLQQPSVAQGLMQVKPHEVLVGLSAGSVAGFSAPACTRCLCAFVVSA